MHTATGCAFNSVFWSGMDAGISSILQIGLGTVSVSHENGQQKAMRVWVAKMGRRPPLNVVEAGFQFTQRLERFGSSKRPENEKDPADARRNASGTPRGFSGKPKRIHLGNGPAMMGPGITGSQDFLQWAQSTSS